MNEGCVLCGAPADWLRPAKRGMRGMEHPSPYCNAHTPEWRVLEYEPLTLIAKQRRASAEHKADKADTKPPKKKAEAAPKTPPPPPPEPPKKKATKPKRRRELPEPDDVPEPDAATKAEIDKGVDEAFR